MTNQRMIDSSTSNVPSFGVASNATVNATGHIPQSKKAPRLTKRMKKALRGANKAMRASLELKNRIGKYVGMNPVYRDMSTVENPTAGFVKTHKGVPFVRVEA